MNFENGDSEKTGVQSFNVNKRVVTTKLFVRIDHESKLSLSVTSSIHISVHSFSVRVQPAQRTSADTGYKMSLASFERGRSERTYGPTDGRMDGPMDGQTNALIEMRGSI